VKITFLCVGQVKKASIGEASADYLKRIRRYAPAEAVEVKDEGASPKVPREDVLRKEGHRILSALGQGGYTVVLADTGSPMTSAAFSKFFTTSVAVSSLPLWNLAPLRRVSVTDWPS